MPKSTLHALSVPKINSIKATTKEQVLNDGGGLYLYVRTHSTKDWVFRYTSPITKNRRKQSLGSYPDTDLKSAREHAARNRALISQGIDPLTQAQDHQKEALKKSNDQKKINAKTVILVFYQWKKEDLQNRKDKGDETERMFKKDVFPEIGNKPIVEVTRDDIKTILARPLRRKANRLANRLLSDLKQFFGYADDEELIKQDPTRRLKKDRTGGAEKSRKRVLSKDELKLLKIKLPQSELLERYQHAIRLYLATGCRRRELAHTELKNIELKNRNLFIPADKSKNTDAHDIYLSDYATKQIIAIKNLTGNDKWLFPNRKANGPITESAITKQITDRQPKPIKQGIKSKFLRGRINNNSLELPNGHWIVHDLRRTAATIMQELGIMPHVVKRCLNQRTEDKIEETYQRAGLEKEQRIAFTKLGKYLEKTFG